MDIPSLKSTVLTLLSLFHLCQTSLALTFELPDNERLCFYESYTGSSKHFFEYKVLKGGRTDVDASVESPNGKILYKETKRKNDKIMFESSVGDFKFCFSNEFSTISHKVVYFRVRTLDEDTLAVRSGNKKPTVNTATEAALENVYEMAKNAAVFQTDYRLKEARGRYMADLLNQRVQWWSIGQAAVVMLTGFGQVFILKMFFTDKRPSSKPSKEPSSETTMLTP